VLGSGASLVVVGREGGEEGEEEEEDKKDPEAEVRTWRTVSPLLLVLPLFLLLLLLLHHRKEHHRPAAAAAVAPAAAAVVVVATAAAAAAAAAAASPRPQTPGPSTPCPNFHRFEGKAKTSTHSHTTSPARVPPIQPPLPPLKDASNHATSFRPGPLLLLLQGNNKAATAHSHSLPVAHEPKEEDYSTHHYCCYC